jgi:hypothetical protein
METEALNTIPNNWIELIKNIIEGLAIIVGGGWALYRFGLFREKYPSMEISNGFNYIGENSNEYLVELFCFVENKGKVRKWIAPFDFELLFLKENNNFEHIPELNEEVRFNRFLHKMTLDGNRKPWVHPLWYIPFVDGMSKRRFHHITSIPKDYKFLILNTRFIDFNSKKTAVNYIISLVDKESDEHQDKKNKLSFKERLLEIRKLKSDYYYTQEITDIDTIKCSKNIFNNGTQQLV